MKVLNSISVALLLVFSIIPVPSVQAQSTFHRITHVTFSGPVEIPGKVLPAGDYVFQLDVLPSNETSIVEIRDKNGENTIATLLTIPDYRLTPTGNTVILFRERAGDSPAALRAWFYPGENYGHEFAYPRREATQLAAANRVNVPAITDNTSDSDLKSAQVTQATANDDQTEVANTTPPEPTPSQDPQTPQTSANDSHSSQDNNLVASNQPLPKTASLVFLIALLGGLLVAAGLSFGFVLRSRPQDGAHL
jgi:hypothetical protein